MSQSNLIRVMLGGVALLALLALLAVALPSRARAGAASLGDQAAVQRLYLIGLTPEVLASAGVGSAQLPGILQRCVQNPDEFQAATELQQAANALLTEHRDALAAARGASNAVTRAEAEARARAAEAGLPSATAAVEEALSDLRFLVLDGVADIEAVDRMASALPPGVVVPAPYRLAPLDEAGWRDLSAALRAESTAASGGAPPAPHLAALLVSVRALPEVQAARAADQANRNAVEAAIATWLSTP